MLLTGAKATSAGGANDQGLAPVVGIERTKPGTRTRCSKCSPGFGDDLDDHARPDPRHADLQRLDRPLGRGPDPHRPRGYRQGHIHRVHPPGRVLAGHTGHEGVARPPAREGCSGAGVKPDRANEIRHG